MHKLILGAIIGAFFVGVANAQPPQEIAVTDAIEFRLGETRVYQFDQPVAKIVLASAGIARVEPQTDHIFTIQAQNPGEVLAVAYGEDGNVVHRMNIVVTTPGHTVKIYGYRDVPDYVGFVCTKGSCGRADPDAPKAGSESVTVTKPTRDGSGWVSTRKNYP